MATVLAVQNDIVPPTINNVNPDPELDPKLNLTFNKAQKRTINYAISNTFGFGGHNAAVVVKKYTA
jgi:3-oxoacyl-[acyl-carrier-protein] synthase II